MYSASPMTYVGPIVLILVFGLSIFCCCCWMHYREKRKFRDIQLRMNQQRQGAQSEFFIPEAPSIAARRRGVPLSQFALHNRGSALVRSLRHSLRRYKARHTRLVDQNDGVGCHRSQSGEMVLDPYGLAQPYRDNPSFVPESGGVNGLQRVRQPPSYRNSPPPPYSDSPVHTFDSSHNTHATETSI